MRTYHKFKAKPTELDGIKFPSKKQAMRHEELKILKRAGEVLFWLREIPIRLPGGVVYKVDNIIFWNNGEVTFEDVKGYKTDMYKVKKN